MVGESRRSRWRRMARALVVGADARAVVASTAAAVREMARGDLTRAALDGVREPTLRASLEALQQTLRAVVRGLCVVQASACLFFALAPARFPYGLSQHLDTLLTLGSEFMVIVPLMLGLGWGVLRLPWQLKLLGPLAVLLYFSLWLPHQVVLHAWVLTQASVLFMPVLFLCFGLLLDCWLFISLYAWLVSLTPRTPQPADRP